MRREIPGLAGSQRFFAASAVWNAPVPRLARLDPSSSALVASLAGMASTTGTGFSNGAWSTPVYTASASQRTVFVRLAPSPTNGQVNPDLQRALAAVPIPPGAQPASGSDEHMVIYQPASDTMWEFWHARLQSDGWHADYGGRIVGVSTNPGYYQSVLSADGAVQEAPGWGATATSLPLLGGLITFHDLKLGAINHAVALAVPQVRAGVMAWPAERSDGKSTATTSIPEGARFRLDPSLNIASLNLPPLVRMIALAAQRYGLIVRDGGGAVAVYGQAPTTAAQASAWAAVLGGMRPYQVMQPFPWNRLQLLKMSLSPYPG